jgi:hypothetical protein
LCDVSRRLRHEYAVVAAIVALAALAIEVHGGLGALFSLAFAPRGECGSWDVIGRELYRTSNAMTVGAYATIAAVLLSPAPITPRDIDSHPQRARDGRTVFGVFIAVCTLTHVEGWLAFQLPFYHLFAICHVANAGVSWVAALWLLRRRAERLSAA